MSLAKIIDFTVQEFEENRVDIRVNFANSPSIEDLKDHFENRNGVVYKKLQKLGYIDISGKPTKKFSVAIHLHTTEDGFSPDVTYHIFQRPPSAYDPTSN